MLRRIDFEGFPIEEWYSQKMSLNEIGRRVGCNSATVRKELVERGVQIRPKHERAYKVVFNRDRFREIKSQTDAYWLGFLCADGSIAKYHLAITLHEKDRDHLVKFCEYMEADPDDRIRKHGPKSLYVSFPDKGMVERLTALGCKPNKSNTLEPPPLTDYHLIQAYLLGYFDGDGWIGLHKDNLILGLTSGSLPFLKWAKIQIRREIEARCTIHLQKNPRGSAYYFRIYGNEVENLLEYWYFELNTPHLERKYDLYLLNTKRFWQLPIR